MTKGMVEPTASQVSGPALNRRSRKAAEMLGFGDIRQSSAMA
jgi:hypothetical protein